MTVQRMDHIGLVVDDLDATIAFFTALGLELEGGKGHVEGERVDRIVGLEGVSSNIAMLRAPDGTRCFELIEFLSPPLAGDGAPLPANVRGLRHVCFAVDDLEDCVARLREHGGELLGEVVRYGDSYVLCYLRGPAGIIVELAEAVG